ncbi:MAG: DUF4910 domain-containing protein [archaeon]
MIELIKELYLLNRSLVTDDFDKALTILKKEIPICIKKYQSGQECFTWIIPEKWVIKSAYIEFEGKKILDFKNHPLHVLSYSLSVNKTVSKQELLKHLFFDKNRPKAIPYVFKYYERGWGFCMPFDDVQKLKEGNYKVVIDSCFEKGELKVGELLIKGKNQKIIAIISHLCHPGQANDDLSGVSVSVEIAKELLSRKNKYSYLFLYVPETIGSIAYLANNEKMIPDIEVGMFLEMLGNENSLVLQRTRQDNTKLDRIARYVLKKRSHESREGGFRKIVGNDEMVFNGPGIDIPTISISRSPYPEYHTSDDNLSIIKEEKLLEAKEVVNEIIEILEKDFIPIRKFKGPLFLSRYGLWVDYKVDKELNRNIEQIMLNLEGELSVFEISEKLNMDFSIVYDYIIKMKAKGVVDERII